MKKQPPGVVVRSGCTMVRKFPTTLTRCILPSPKGVDLHMHMYILIT